jgi:hypothetical protein
VDGLLEMAIETLVPSLPRHGMMLRELVTVIGADEWVGIKVMGAMWSWWRQ